MLNEAKINEIAAAMGTDEAKIKAYVEMTPEDAAAEFSKMGYDITANDLVEFGEYITNKAAEGEINEADLDQVSGGSVTGAVFLIGVLVGMTAAKNGWKW